jgi:hypothetical protein
MPFLPRFKEAAEAELIDNIIEVVDRDMLLALNYFYASDNLPDFGVKTIGDISVFDYPILIIGPERMASEETDDGFYLSQDYRVGVGLVVKDVSVKLAVRKAMKYVRSLKAVLRSASTADLFPPSAQILNHVLDIDHRYFRHGTAGQEFTQAVELELKFKFGEK